MTAPRITPELLEQLGACPGAHDAFAAIQHLPQTVELAVAHANKFDWGWAARKMLSPELLRAFEEADAPLLRAYKDAHAPLLRAFEEAEVPLRPLYLEAETAQERAAYEEARDPLLRVYMDAKAPLRPAYLEARARLFAMLYLHGRLPE